MLAKTFVVEGQAFFPSMDAGVFGGTSYYIGDINPRRQFYKPELSLGVMLKQNVTEHHSFRMNVFWGQLTGDDLDFTNKYQQMRAHSFETVLLDCHAGFEFNFKPYIVKRQTRTHSTYIFAAVGYSLILSTTADIAGNHVTVPFGAGFKYRFNDWVTLGCEWGMRKTFNDTIDGLLNHGTEGSYAATHNNDWYSFAGVYLTFRVFQKGFKCPGVFEERTYK